MTDVNTRLQLHSDTISGWSADLYQGRLGRVSNAPLIGSAVSPALGFYNGSAWEYTAMRGGTEVFSNVVLTNEVFTAGTLPRITTLGALDASCFSDDGTNATVSRPLALRGASLPAWSSLWKMTAIGNASSVGSYDSGAGSNTIIANNLYNDGSTYRAISATGTPALFSFDFNGGFSVNNSLTTPTAGGVVSDVAARFSVSRRGQISQCGTEKVASALWSKTSTTTIANTTTETSLWGGAQSVPASRISAAGQVIGIKAAGRVSCLNAAGYTIKVKVGSTVIGTGTGSFPAALSGQAFRVEGDLTFWTVGASGGAMGYIMFHFTTSVGQAQPYVIPVVLSSTTTAWDTTTAQNIDITMTWGAGSASNSMSCDHGKITIT